MIDDLESLRAENERLKKELESEKAAFRIMVENNKMANDQWDAATTKLEEAEKALIVIRANLVRLALDENAIMIEGVHKALANLKGAE